MKTTKPKAVKPISVKEQELRVTALSMALGAHGHPGADQSAAALVERAGAYLKFLKGQ